MATNRYANRTVTRVIASSGLALVLLMTSFATARSSDFAEATTSSEDTATATQDISFGNPVKVSGDNLPAPSDPHIAISGNGVFVVALDDVNSDSRHVAFFKSNDRGKSFASPKFLNEVGGSIIDPWVVASGEHVYVVWIEVNALGSNILFRASHDGGDTFGPAINLSNDTAFSIDVTIAADENNVYVVWKSFPEPNGLILRASHDAGVNFTPNINLSKRYGIVGFELPIAAAENNLYLGWTGFDGNQSDFLFKKSVNGAATFDKRLDISNSPNPDIFPDVAASQNKVYAVWTNGLSGQSEDVFFSVSKDKGASFTKPINVSNLPSSDSIQPAIAESGSNVFVFWDEAGPDLLAVSRDGGMTYTAPINISERLNLPQGYYSVEVNSIAALEDNVYLVWAGNGIWLTMGWFAPAGYSIENQVIDDYSVYLLLRKPGDANEASELFFSKSISGGRTFSTPIKIISNDFVTRSFDHFSSILDLKMIVEDHKFIDIVWSDDARVHFISSGSAGNNWGPIRTPSQITNSTRPDIDAAGASVFLTYQADDILRSCGENSVYFKRDTVFDWLAFTPRQFIACGEFPEVQLLDDTGLHMQTKWTTNNHPYMRESFDGGTTFGPVKPLFFVNLVNTVSTDGRPTSISRGSDGLPMITTVNPVTYIHCGDASCASGNTIIPIATGEYYDAGVVSGSDGLPIIAYSSTEHVFVVHCGNVLCSDGNVATTPVSRPYLYASLDINVGSDGLPVIAYQEAADISMLHCGDITCSSGNTIQQNLIDLDELTRVEMAIGSDGLPIIVAGDDSRNFRGVHCGALDCASGNTAFAHDGIVPDITIGSDGLPILSYLDDLLTHSDVMVMHCGNLTCTSGNTVTAVKPVSQETSELNELHLYTSIAKTSDGHPIVTIFDHNQENDENVDELLTFYCGNLDCSGSSNDKLTTIDSGSGGLLPSIIIGEDGFPIMAYSASGSDFSGHGPPKVAHCGSVHC